MKYYRTWQEALIDYIERFGRNYKDIFTLTADFEEKLNKNNMGTYYIYFGETK